jgi:hypothetical protein
MRPQLFFVVFARVLFAALVVVICAEAGWQQWGLGSRLRWNDG